MHWRDGTLLAAEVCDDSGRVKGVRPLGGSVEFGETVKAALIREFREELNIEVTAKGEPIIMENIYSHEGSLGHEILFIFEIEFPSGALENVERVTFHEANGIACNAAWFDPDELDLEGKPELYPKGLKELLIHRSSYNSDNLRR